MARHGDELEAPDPLDETTCPSTVVTVDVLLVKVLLPSAARPSATSAASFALGVESKPVAAGASTVRPPAHGLWLYTLPQR